MDRKSEVFLNLINTFIYQVESGQAYAQTPDVSLDDIEYVGFTLIVGAGDSGTYHCHAYGYEEGSRSHIMTLNAGGLIAKIKDFAKTSAEDGAPAWKTCIIEIPEDLSESSADFLFGRDAEPWVTASLKISEFVRPGTNADKDIEWNQRIYEALHGIKRTEGLPKKRYVGAIEDLIPLDAALEAELDDDMSSSIESLFSHQGDFVAVSDLPPETFFPPVRKPIQNPAQSLPTALHSVSATETQELESMFAESQQEPVMAMAEVSVSRKSATDVENNKKSTEAKAKWGLGRKKAEPAKEPEIHVEPIAAEPVKPKKVVPPPKIVPKNEILPSFLRYSEHELKEKNIDCAMASIIVYLQPPDITSYGFWYGEGNQGHWMPESFDLDDTMDAFLRDTIPDPKNHWDVCIIRMDLESHKITTEFLKGRPGYAWMEPMSHRSKSLSEIARYKKPALALVEPLKEDS